MSDTSDMSAVERTDQRVRVTLRIPRADGGQDCFIISDATSVGRGPDGAFDVSLTLTDAGVRKLARALMPTLTDSIRLRTGTRI